ncbi:MAG: EAL domain-containing protein [Gammaproteobacteria bacterium]|nr:EAL domain-containing protein [Gammaproteobacteria bacterium]
MQNNLRRDFHRTYRVRLATSAAFCLLFTLLLIWVVIRFDISNAEKRFLAKTDTAFVQLLHQLDSGNSLITALTGWHHTHHGAENNDLSTFTREMQASYPHVTSVIFLPKITESQRANFESEMIDNGYANFSIKDKTDLRFITASKRPVYYPVTYLRPLRPESAGILGLDMSSLTITADSIDTAIHSSKTEASMPVQLLGEKQLYLFKAVYKGTITPDSEQQRSEQVAGIYAVGMATNKLLEAIKEMMGTPSTQIKLVYNKTTQTGSNVVFEHLPHANDLTNLPLHITFNATLNLQQIKQPFTLIMERQLLLSDLSLTSIAFIIIIALILMRSIQLSLQRDRLHNLTHELAKDDIFREKELAEVTLNSIADGVITTDVHNLIEHMNPVAENLCGWSLSQAKKKPLKKILHLVKKVSGRSDAFSTQPPGIETSSETHASYVLRQHQGKEFVVRISAAPIRNRDGIVMGSVIVFRDITKEQKLAEMLSHQARHDELTGLLNRREFERSLRLALKSPTSLQTDVLCYLDLDQFKLVNDTCGHMAGDELLKQISNALKQSLGPQDIFARLGGDEFGILFHQRDIGEAVEAASQLQHKIRTHRFSWNGKVFEIGSSMGLVQITPDIGSVEQLMIAADSACYIAKDKGRNRIVVHTRDSHELQQRSGDMEWLHRIKRAMDNQQLRLFLQKVLPVQDLNAPAHFEVLLRLQDEQKFISPSTFIPAAEHYNFMPQIDKWVISHAFDLISQNPTTSDTFNINLSGKSINDETILSFIINEFKRSKITPNRVCFEITETATIANLSNASQLIEELRLMGCQFALDDFGSGLSSYSYLKNLPVDYLKIDGSFICNILRDPVDHAMVKSIVQIGHVMGIRTIAEFVETEAIALELCKLGVDYVQGYGIHRPQPWRDVIASAELIPA